MKRMSSSNYKLEYFPVQGKGELIRLLFYQAGVDFCDYHVKLEEWMPIKSNPERIPLGTVPVLSVAGKLICQSRSIERYLARKFKLYGANDDERSVIDQVVDTLKDFQEGYFGLHFMTDIGEDQKALKMSAYCSSNDLMRKLTFLENILKRNNSGDGFFVGNTISMADLALVAAVEQMEKSLLDKFPLLVQLKKKVAESSKIEAYLSKREIPFVPSLSDVEAIRNK